MGICQPKLMDFDLYAQCPIIQECIIDKHTHTQNSTEHSIMSLRMNRHQLHLNHLDIFFVDIHI